MILSLLPTHSYLPEVKEQDKSYLWMVESPISLEFPPTEDTRSRFRLVFTWSTELADGKTIFQVMIPYSFKEIDWF